MDRSRSLLTPVLKKGNESKECLWIRSSWHCTQGTRIRFYPALIKTLMEDPEPEWQPGSSPCFWESNTLASQILLWIPCCFHATTTRAQNWSLFVSPQQFLPSEFSNDSCCKCLPNCCDDLLVWCSFQGCDAEPENVAQGKFHKILFLRHLPFFCCFSSPM